MTIRFQIADLETQNHEWYGELASPRCPDNFVVMQGQRDCEVDGAGNWKFYPRQEYRYADRKQWLAEKSLHIHPETNVLVAHNAPYELSWWMNHYADELTAFLKRGGRVYCTAYAHYLLSNQQSQYPALSEIAPGYGGSHKIDAVKVMWESGYLTSQIDPELLSEYLSGPQGDIENTTKVLVGTWEGLVKRGMLSMALTRMDGMLMWARMMQNGLHVDREVAEANRQELLTEIAELTSKILELLPADMPQAAREQFKMSSQYHMSAFVFGGVMKYRARVPRTDKDGNPIWEKEDAAVFTFQKEKWEKPTRLCRWDEESGLWYDEARKVHCERVTRGKLAGQPRVVRVDTAQQAEVWDELLVTLPGLLPDKDRRAKEIADNLVWENVRRVGDWVGKCKLADGTPVFSTSADVMEILANRNIPGIADISRRTKLQKDASTYYLIEELDDDGNVTKMSGMLQYVQPDSVVYHTLNMTASETTRLTASRPNSQNLPRKGTSKVKQMFASRFPGGRIVEADYSALEVVGLCAFSHDRALTRALLQGIDMHCMRLAAQLGEDYDSVLLKAKDEGHEMHPLYSAMRTAIKPKAFSYQYGATARGIAYSTGCTEEEAQAFIDNEKKLFPEVETWFDECVFPEVERTGANVIHREQGDNGVWQMYHRGTWTSPAGTSYSFRQYLQWNGQARSYLMQYKPTQMRNYPIQGESAFWVQGIGGLLFRWLLANDFFGGKALPINQVHDAFYIDTAPDCPREFFVGLKAIMECIPEYFNHIWPAYNIHVPFPVEVEVGDNMMDKHHFVYEPGEVEAYKQQYLRSKGIDYQLR